MPDTRYLDTSEVELAERISKGLEPSEGYRILTKSEYFSRPTGYCLHPQGWPCFKSCIKQDGPSIQETRLPGMHRWSRVGGECLDRGESFWSTKPCPGFSL